MTGGGGGGGLQGRLSHSFTSMSHTHRLRVEGREGGGERFLFSFSLCSNTLYIVQCDLITRNGVTVTSDSQVFIIVG